MIYNVPSRTNLNISPATLRRLADIDNIVAVKECNLLQAAETIYLCGDKLDLYSGEDGNIVPLLARRKRCNFGYGKYTAKRYHNMVKSFRTEILKQVANCR